MTTAKHNWPARDQRLFVEHPQRWMNAIIHPYVKKGLTIADAFKNAADRLVDSVDPAGTEQDHFAVPILFLYRHHLELELKDLIRSCRKALGQPQSELFTHNLLQLWQTCRPLLEKIEPRDPDHCFDAVESLLVELSNVDPFAMTFRYAHNKTGNETLTPLDAFDLRHLRDMVDGISSFFGGCDGVVDQYSDYRADVGC